MTGRDLFLEEQLLRLFWKFQQTQGVRNRRTSLRHGLRDFRLRHVASLHQATITIGFLDGIQIGPLHVLDQC